MLRVRDFRHFCPEGEVGTVGSASFSDWKRLRLRFSTQFGRFQCPVCARREGAARHEIDQGD